MSTKHTITIVFGLVFFPIIVNSQNPILIPPLLIGPNFELEMTQDSHAYYPGVPVESMGFNGSILGPTLLMVKDQSVTINVLNSLGEESTVHWHGLHVAAENDGGPHSVIAPNDNLEVNFEVLDRAATYWYHPHLHHYTTKHVQLGLSGFIITKDSEEASLNSKESTPQS